MIKAILLVGAGSFAGGVLRFIVSILMQGKWAPKDFPYHTLAVNVIGCAAIGVVFALMNRAGAGEGIRLFAITGVLGGFTTFSAFSLDFFRLVQSGNTFQAAVYVIASVVLGLCATYAAYKLVAVQP